MNNKFYTAVETIGSTVFVREVVDGIPNMRKEQWNPTLYDGQSVRLTVVIAAVPVYSESLQRLL